MILVESHKDYNISIDTSDIQLGMTIRMHAIGGDASKDFDKCSGKVTAFDKTTVVVDIENAPHKPAGYKAKDIRFGIYRTGWAFEIISQDGWDI